MHLRRLVPLTILAFACMGLVSCASGEKRSTAPSNSPEPDGPETRPVKNPLVGGVRCIDAGKGRISAVTLRDFIKKRPPFLLQGLSLDRHPPKEYGPFQGWRITAVSNACLARALRPGDIILSVNGNRIERPSDLQKLWELLPNASFLDVVLVRAGKVLTRRYRVVEKKAQ
jgi:hypothetical protein